MNWLNCPRSAKTTSCTAGYNAHDEPFTHYDKAAGKSVTLYADDAELEQERSQITDSLKLVEEVITGLRSELKTIPKGDRALRSKLLSDIAENGLAMKALKERRNLLDSLYQNDDARRLFAAEYEIISTLARDGCVAKEISSEKVLRVHFAMLLLRTSKRQTSPAFEHHYRLTF